MPGMKPSGPPQRMNGLGNASLDITTTNPEARLWFEQGLNLLHDFWDFESSRAFEASVKADPNCAMCWWGLAYAAGPFANKAAAPVPPDLSYPVFTPQELELAQGALQQASEALQSEGYRRALGNTSGLVGEGARRGARERERLYIDAMHGRYSGGSAGPTWEAAERGYAAAMESIGRPGTGREGERGLDEAGVVYCW